MNHKISFSETFLSLLFKLYIHIYISRKYTQCQVQLIENIKVDFKYSVYFIWT